MTTPDKEIKPPLDALRSLAVGALAFFGKTGDVAMREEYLVTLLLGAFQRGVIDANDRIIRRNDRALAADAALSTLPVNEGQTSDDVGMKETLERIRDFTDTAAKYDPVFRAINNDARAALKGVPQPATPQRHGIYIASKTRHAERWRFLRDMVGEPIISTWIDKAGEGESAGLDNLWRRCISEAANCEVLILYREPGDILKGGWIELGAALANGVPVFAVGIEGYTIAKHRGVRHFPDMKAAVAEARRFLRSAVDQPASSEPEATTTDRICPGCKTEVATWPYPYMRTLQGECWHMYCYHSTADTSRT